MADGAVAEVVLELAHRDFVLIGQNVGFAVNVGAHDRHDGSAVCIIDDERTDFAAFAVNQ